MATQQNRWTIRYFIRLVAQVDWKAVAETHRAIELIGGPYDGCMYPFKRISQKPLIALPTISEKAAMAHYAVYERLIGEDKARFDRIMSRQELKDAG